MNYLGDFAVGQEVYVWFNTFDSNDPSASVTMTTFIDTDVHIHKDDSLVQRNDAAGVEVDIDVDGIVGVHKITIHTDDNTVANFYEAGHDYAVRIEGATVDAALINPVVGTFSIANRRVAGEMCRSSIEGLTSQTVFTLTSGEASAQDDAYNNCTIIVTDQTTRIQKAVAQISDYTGTTRTVTLVAAPLATGYTMAIGDSVEILATSAFANVGSWVGTAVTTSSVTAKPEVDAFSISNAAVTADRLEAWMNGAVTASVEGTPTASVIQTDLAEVSDDHFNHMVVVITGGTVLGQARRISDYVGATGTLTVQPPFTEAPVATDTLMVLPLVVGGLDNNGRMDLGAWLGTAVTGDGDWTQLQTAVDGVQTDLDNGTDGLGALKALLDMIPMSDGTVSWNATALAAIESEVNDALDTAISELGVAAPTSTPTIRTALMLMYMALRNKLVVQTSATDALEIYNNAGTKICSKLLTDDGSDYTESQAS